MKFAEEAGVKVKYVKLPKALPKLMSKDTGLAFQR